MFIGNLDPRDLPARPWHSAHTAGSRAEGRFGRILQEKKLYALVKFADTFDLVHLAADFLDEAAELLRADDALGGADLSRFKNPVDPAALRDELAAGALPLVSDGKTLGCIKAAHPRDVNLAAHTMLENLSSKATAVYALRRLLADNRIDPRSIDYIIETSEEACGDMNQRGGGNFAKSIGELAALSNATGCDVRSFCAGPVHGLLQAASLIRAGSVAAGGGRGRRHHRQARHEREETSGEGISRAGGLHGLLCRLLEGGAPSGLRVRNDLTGMLQHRVRLLPPGGDAGPRGRAPVPGRSPLLGHRLSTRPSSRTPRSRRQAGAGNVTLANMKMIAAMAVMKKEIEKPDMDAFIAAHGTSGWAPTQGHIPSGIPALGWFLVWARAGSLRRGMLIGKGSLFLGRMTGLFDGVSILLEAGPQAREESAAGQSMRAQPARQAGAQPAPAGGGPCGSA